MIVAENIAKQIEGNIAYRRAVRMSVSSTMRVGAEGIKVLVSGRLNGAEMARSEMYKEGRTPLHTLRADIDYHQAEALTKVGLLGIKVWICRGEKFGKQNLSPSYKKDKKAAKKRAHGGRNYNNHRQQNNRQQRGNNRFNKDKRQN